jgi:hypothetical protein
MQSVSFQHHQVHAAEKFVVSLHPLGRIDASYPVSPIFPEKSWMLEDSC